MNRDKRAMEFIGQAWWLMYNTDTSVETDDDQLDDDGLIRIDDDLTEADLRAIVAILAMDAAAAHHLVVCNAIGFGTRTHNLRELRAAEAYHVGQKIVLADGPDDNHVDCGG